MPNYYDKVDGNGIIGAFVIMLIYFGVFILNAFIFYNYLVFIHMNGRLLDIYVRLSGTLKNLFIPHDNEVSYVYFNWVYLLAKRNNNRIIVTKNQGAFEKEHQAKQSIVVHIYRFSKIIFLTSPSD